MQQEPCKVGARDAELPRHGGEAAGRSVLGDRRVGSVVATGLAEHLLPAGQIVPYLYWRVLGDVGRAVPDGGCVWVGGQDGASDPLHPSFPPSFSYYLFLPFSLPPSLPPPPPPHPSIYGGRAEDADGHC
jgi:hypothetical protein